MVRQAMLLRLTGDGEVKDTLRGELVDAPVRANKDVDLLVVPNPGSRRGRRGLRSPREVRI